MIALRLPRTAAALRLALRWAGDINNPVNHLLEAPGAVRDLGERLASHGWAPWETAAIGAEIAFACPDCAELAQAAGDASADLFASMKGGERIAAEWRRGGAEAIRRYLARAENGGGE